MAAGPAAAGAGGPVPGALLPLVPLPLVQGPPAPGPRIFPNGRPWAPSSAPGPVVRGAAEPVPAGRGHPANPGSGRRRGRSKGSLYRRRGSQICSSGRAERPAWPASGRAAPSGPKLETRGSAGAGRGQPGRAVHAGLPYRARRSGTPPGRRCSPPRPAARSSAWQRPAGPRPGSRHRRGGSRLGSPRPWSPRRTVPAGPVGPVCLLRPACLVGSAGHRPGCRRWLPQEGRPLPGLRAVRRRQANDSGARRCAPVRSTGPMTYGFSWSATSSVPQAQRN